MTGAESLRRGTLAGKGRSAIAAEYSRSYHGWEKGYTPIVHVNHADILTIPLAGENSDMAVAAQLGGRQAEITDVENNLVEITHASAEVSDEILRCRENMADATTTSLRDDSVRTRRRMDER